MGFISFALHGSYKKYYKSLKKLSKENGKSANIMFLDTAFCALILKSGLQDYLNYKFYEKPWKERKEYATIGYQSKFYEIAANVKYAPFFSNKVNFNKNFKKFVKRECLSYKDGFDKIKDFIEKHDYIVRKPINGLGGTSVQKIKTSDIENVSDFYEKLKTNNALIEELVIQNEDWAALSPNSLNTLRVVTKCINGKSSVLFAAARIGSGKSIVDNFHQGGVGVKINIKKGILEGNAIDKNNNVSKEAPASGIVVDGFKIPYWDEVVEMTCEAAKVNDNVNIVGWDVALTPNGPLIIEGNRGPGMDLIQVLYNRGVKRDLEQIKKEILESKC